MLIFSELNFLVLKYLSRPEYHEASEAFMKCMLQTKSENVSYTPRYATYILQFDYIFYDHTI